MPLRDDLLNPIPGDSPSGANLRYAPVFDKIKEARRQDDDAPTGIWETTRKVADWAAVVKMASETLATQTKDLQLAAWLVEALVKKDGLPGLHEGLQFTQQLTETFWDSIHPEGEDGDYELRASSLEWIGSRLVDAVKFAPLVKGGYGFYKQKESKTVPLEKDCEEDEEKKAQRDAAIAEGKLSQEEWQKALDSTPTATIEATQQAIEGSLATIEGFAAYCDEKFGDVSPSFIPLRTSLEEVQVLVRNLLKQKYEAEGGAPEPEEVAQEESTGEEESYSSGYEEAPVARPKKRSKAVAGLEPADVDEAALRLGAVAKFLRQADPYSPGPYLLLRGYRWGELRGFGNPPDPTLLVPPPTEVRQRVRSLALEANWAELLEVAEEAMAEPCGRAWLDLQRYVVRACDEYGYPAIAAAIRSEVKALVRDLPELPTWTLMDDTPTANAETQAWIQEMIAADAPPPVEAAEPVYHEPAYQPEPVRMEEHAYSSNGDGEPAPPDTFELAMQAARSGRTSDAIEMLAQDIPRQNSGRGRFQRKLQIAQICMSTGNEDLALPILQELEQQINEHHLDAWESADIVAHPLAMLYRCLNKTGGDSSMKQALYARVSRLDPVQALSMPR
jgi:type VI secretion system protein ImpA